MFQIYLSQSNIIIIGPIAKLLGFIINIIYNFLEYFGIINVGLVIILFTFIVRSLMIPLTLKQQKYSKLSSKMSPELTKINAKYKGKKDPETMRKMQEESQAIYAKYGASPTAGCLPILVQLPIMFALYQVIYRIPAYINNIKVLYENIVVKVVDNASFQTFINDFVSTRNLPIKIEDTTNHNNVIDILSNFSSTDWNSLIELFVNSPEVAEIIRVNSEALIKSNTFLGGINIAEAPGLAFPAIIIPLLAALTQYISTKLMSSLQTLDSSNPMASTMKSMNVIMPIMSAVFCITFPAGIGIYWIAGSVFQIVQQFFVNKHMDKIDMDELIKKNVEKANKKKARLGIDPSKPMNTYTKASTRSIHENKPLNSTSINSKSISAKSKISTNSNTKVTDNSKPTYSSKPGGIAANANLLNNRNNEKGEK